ncbi:MAG: sigma-70 family RNA polymerase sigma factor [Rhodanobacteraceae bacterium]|nr:sigma-70 family RNA polymerase sigma factor [Rhodanobacteraceae bacterium]
MSTPPITQLLERWRCGEAGAADALMNVVYPLLRELAQQRLRRFAPGATLQPTELANEAYLRLLRARATDWSSRAHFFAISAKVVRNLAVDYARGRASAKRGGDLVMLPLDEMDDVPAVAADIDVLGIDLALVDLEREDAVLGQIVELKYFSGLDTDEIAEVCGISRASVVRRWRYARAWLADRLKSLA